MSVQTASVLIGNRYQLLGQVGSGSMGTVHRAVDRLSGDTVALKQVTMPGERLQFASLEAGGDFRLALAQEFRTLASLRHPHIVSVLDYGFAPSPRQGDAGRQPFFTMDLLEGAQTLLEAAESQPQEMQIALLVQVLQALAYLHRQGILHRDLKPANVLVTDRVKVLDFGLADTLAQAQGTVGTLTYMAPEVVCGQEASQAADLYAVGVMAYQLLVGRYPFDTCHPLRLKASILHVMPDLSSLKNRQLAAVLARWLEKDPGQRYADADEVIVALSESIGQPPPRESRAIRESFLQAARFVGRDAELSRLTESLERAARGQGSAWLVGGESGVGKSRLLDELRTRALVAGALVIRGQAVEGGGALYQLWRDPLRRLALVTELGDLEASVVKPLVHDLDTLLEREIPAAPELEGEAARQRLHLTVAEICRTAARTAPPLLLLLEDLHWTDESLGPLQALNRLVAGLPLLVVGTYRSEEGPDLPAALPTMNVLPLARLSPESMAELSTSMLGRAGREPQVLDLLQRETEGNAFFLVETVRALAEGAGRLGAVGDMPLPQTVFTGGVQQIVRRRLARVPEPHQPLLNLAAVAGRALDLVVLGAAQPGTHLEAWLTDCANLAVLEVQEGQWRFAHDKLRAEILAAMAEAERSAHHRQVAKAYERAYPAAPRYAATLTSHWEAAGEIKKTAQYARLAGEYAAGQYVNEEALHFYGKALALTPEDEPARRFDLYLLREEIYARLGQRVDQAADLERLKALARTPAQQTNLALRYGAYHNNVGEYEAAIEISERVYQWAGEYGVPSALEKQAQALINIARAHQRQSNYETAAQYYSQAFELAQSSNEQVQIAQTRSGIGEISYSQGDYATAQQYHQQALEMHRRLDNQLGQVEALRNLGEAANAQGDYKTARIHYQDALELARQIGDRPVEGKLLLDLGVNYWRQADYQLAEINLQNSLRLAQTTGDRRTAATALRHLGNVATGQGQYEQASGYYERCFVVCKEIGDQDGMGKALNNLGLVAVRQGRYAQATSHLERSLVIAQEVGNRAGPGKTLNNLGMIAERQGKCERAKDYYQRSLAITQEIGDRAMEGITLHNLGVIARQQRQYASAEDFFQQSLGIAQEIGDQERIGRSLNSLGNLASHQGQTVRAKGYLERSLAIAKEIGDGYGANDVLNNLGNLAYSQGQYQRAIDYYQQSLVSRREIGDQDGLTNILSDLGAVALAQSDLEQAGARYQQTLAIRQELAQPQYLVEIWAGLALVALRQGELETARTHAGQLLTAWVNNPTAQGAEYPMRALDFAWQVCRRLGLAQANDVLASAAGVMQTYLDNHPDPETQAAYLRQPHHRALWRAWQTDLGVGNDDQSR